MAHRFIAMKRSKRKTKTKKRKKPISERKAKVIAVLAPGQAGHTPEATAENKRSMTKALSMGMGPGPAAEAIGIGRSIAFKWKREDPEFNEKWEEARETAWDKLQGRFYDLGMEGEARAIEKTLAARRPEVWRETRSGSSTLTTNLTVKMTLEESQERLRQLGIELRVYEGDQDEDHTIPLLEDYATARNTEDDPSRDR